MNQVNAISVGYFHLFSYKSQKPYAVFTQLCEKEKLHCYVAIYFKWVSFVKDYCPCV